MDYPITDLTNCDKEPIHILGKIQSLGFFIAYSKADNLIAFVSDNLSVHTGLNHLQLLNQPVQSFFDKLPNQTNGQGLVQMIHYGMLNNFENLNPTKVLIQKENFNLICHISGSFVVLEFEPINSDQEHYLQSIIGSSLSKILNGKNLRETLSAAASQVKELIGYDRVMIYQFWEDGHGEVVAEEKNEGLEPLYGLHYPASDIPKQARELYKLNLTRIIADVNAEPANLITLNTKKNRTIDLTHSTLRAVSTIHIEYLKNMGVMASFSVSIMCKGELWGLIACHNHSPKFIDFKARENAKLIGQVLSSSFEYKTDQEQKTDSLLYIMSAGHIMRRMHENWDLLGALDEKQKDLLKVTSASGAAVVFEGKIHIEGATPTKEEILQLTNWLSSTQKPTIYHTNNLSKHFLQASAYATKASGLLACTISKEMGEYLLFFKPERIATIKWAGNPEKPLETDVTGNMKLSPRRSFAVWSQEIKGTSEKWYREEMNTVVKFREDIMHFLSLKSNEIRKLNEKLQEAYEELDAFSFTISHDLKTPLASVKNYAEMVLEEFTDLNDEAKRYVGRIIKGADKMEKLIHEVLGYSKVSRQKFVKEWINMDVLLADIKQELLWAYNATKINLVFKNTPAILGDMVMVSQVFTNIIGNAIKYSLQSDQPTIILNGEATENGIVYSIEDNGIGIDSKYGGQIFELFKRTEDSRQFDGSGVGLAIVKRIMTKHGGMVWYEGKGAGTIFYLKFNNTKD